MIRDSRRDKEYFDAIINHYRDEADFLEDALSSEGVKKPEAIKGWLYSTRLRIVISCYSAGYPLEQVASEFSKTLKFIDRLSDNIIIMEGNKLPLDQYNLMLWTSSLAVLLNQDQANFEKIAASFDRVNKPDRLIDLFLQYKIKTRRIAEDSYYSVVPGDMADRYRPLFTLSGELNDSEKTGVISNYLKHWYKRQQLCAWYGSHKKGNYFGYWSFEAAALVKIHTLQEGALIKSKYFPSGLVGTNA